MECMICRQGQPIRGQTTVTLERGDATLVFKSVPALICDNCGEVETLIHYFFDCVEVRNFWIELTNMLNARLPPRKRIWLTRYKVIFGDVKYSQAINVIILLAKQFIYTQRIREGLMNVTLFSPCVRNTFNPRTDGGGAGIRPPPRGFSG